MTFMSFDIEWRLNEAERNEKILQAENKNLKKHFDEFQMVRGKKSESYQKKLKILKKPSIR